MRNPQLFAPLALFVFQACGTDVPVPVATDLGNAGDVASDVAVDSSTDAPADTGPDVAPDAVSDTRPDSPADVESDAPGDAESDAPSDVPTDPTIDVGPDTPVEPDVGPSRCDEVDLEAANLELREVFDTIADGISEYPFEISLPEDTNGRLQVGLESGVLPLLGGPEGIFSAAGRLGEGRIVAFSGQDFLSSGDRSTLLGGEGSRLVAQSIAWVGSGTDVDVLVDNAALVAALDDGTFGSVRETPIIETLGLREIRDWNESALDGIEVAVVQVNEWGTLHVDDPGVAALRAFVEGGGGLVIAGSKLHWSWWLADHSEQFPGDEILAGSGLSYVATSIRDLGSARLSFDARSAPEALWCAWLEGESLSDDDLGRLPGLFNDAAVSGDSGLPDALERLVDETPALPVSRTDALARLSATVAAELPPQDWPSLHPWTETQPGLPDASAPVESGRVTIAANRRRAVPLGFYAAPGTTLQITIPDDLTEAGLTILVGERYDDNRGLAHIEPWRRAPMLTREFDADEPEVVVGNAYGGSLYVVIPDETVLVSDFEITVAGAHPQAVFTVERDGSGSWNGTTSAESLVPHTILQGIGKVRMVVPTPAAAEAEPEAVIEFWTGFHESHEALAQEPVARPFESHWIFDLQVGWGYANATSGTSGRITYPELSTGWALRTRTGDEDWWLFAHELGHQFQTADWSGGDITEVAVNLFSLYTLNSYLNDGGNFETVGHRAGAIDYEALESARWASADLFGKLECYRLLVFEFGWEAYQETFASYYDPAFPREEFGGFMDGFAIRFSAIVERDLSPYFLHWEYPISADAVEVIRGLGHEEWLPPGW